MDWQTIIAQTAVQSILLAAVAWLLRTFISQQFAKDLEAFKQRLSTEAEQDRIRFSKLHDRRAEVIEELYKRTVFIISMLRLQNENSTNTAETSENLLRQAVETGSYFGQHALYFPTDLRARFLKVFTKGFPQPLQALYAIGEMEKWEEKLRVRCGDNREINFRGPFLEHLRKQIPVLEQLVEDMEREFQLILGVR